MCVPSLRTQTVLQSSGPKLALHTYMNFILSQFEDKNDIRESVNSFVRFGSCTWMDINIFIYISYATFTENLILKTLYLGHPKEKSWLYHCN